MAAGAGDLERALCRLLPVNVAQVDGILRSFRKHLLGINHNGLKGFRRVYQIHGLRQRLKSKYADALDHCCFPRIGFRDSKRLQAKFAGRERRRERAADRPNTSIKRQLTEEHALVKLFAEKMAHASDESKSHREIERRAFLANVGGRQIDGDALPVREFEAAVAKGRLDALAAFLDGIVRQADDVEILHAGRTHVDFDLDEVGVDAVDRSALRFEEHGRGKLHSAEAA